ncbi:hypothetical protein [Teredinibacter turnerae]|uniref:hypothetical protein n=1 Tax=Teredinibacter turnerae TaxID=2426 RepID=UPI0003614219|nr:hypothetical protein [Teredinibacter turnerae]
MSNSAVVGLLYEAHKVGVDIEKLAERVSAGLMGGEIYAPPGVEQKPQAVDSVKSAMKETLKLIEIKA